MSETDETTTARRDRRHDRRRRPSNPAHRLLLDAGPTVSVPEAGRVLGIGRGMAYELVKRGELGVRVLRLGSRWRVPTADLRRAVGLDDAEPRTDP